MPYYRADAGAETLMSAPTKSDGLGKSRLNSSLITSLKRPSLAVFIATRSGSPEGRYANRSP